MGAGVLTVAVDADASLAEARRVLVVDAVRRLRAASPSGPSPVPDATVAVQGVRVVGRDAAAVTDYGRLVHAIGADAAGYALVRTRRNRPVVVDLDVWARRDEQNPLVRVWAIAVRSRELLRTAAVYGVLPDQAGTLEGETTVRLAAALDAVVAAGRSAAARGEPHRVADQLEQAVVPVHETVLGQAHGQLSTVRDDPAGRDGAAYRSRLSLLSRCAREVGDALAALGTVVPERL